MSAREWVEWLVTLPGPTRVEALAQSLGTGRRVPFRTRRLQGVNLLCGAESPTFILGAHHDIDPGTVQGATDNTAAVGVLAALVHRWDRTGWPAGVGVSFWDLEEPGNGGYADGARHQAVGCRREGAFPEMVVVCDVFGLGGPWLSTRSDPTQVAMLRGAGRLLGEELPETNTPGSDDGGWRREDCPAILLTSLPDSGSKAAWSAMHSPADNLSLIDWDSLERLETFLAGAAEHLGPQCRHWAPPAARDIQGALDLGVPRRQL